MCNWYIVRLIFAVAVFVDIGTSNSPNLSIVRTDDQYRCVLYNDSSNSTITWDTKDEVTADYNTYFNCILNNVSGCTLLGNNWLLKEDYSDFPPVLNELWQGFPPLHLDFEEPFVEPINSDGDFRVSLSFKIDEVHILLCDDDSVVSGNCYYIALGGYRGTKSYLRKCERGYIPVSKTKFPTGDCAKRRTELVNRSVVNSAEWHHFSIVKEGNTYSVWKYGWNQAVLSYIDDSPLNTSYLLLRSPMKEGVAKLHKTNAFVFTGWNRARITLTNPYSCIRLFIKPCQNCTVHIITENEGEVRRPRYTRYHKSVDWEQISLKVPTDGNKQIYVAVRPDYYFSNAFDDQRWYISERIAECHKPDAVELFTYWEGCCYALKYPHQKICTDKLDEYNPGDWQCPSDSIGKNCIPCDYFGYPDCKWSKICDLTTTGVRCSCPHGFYGKNCSQVCSDGSYGFDCRGKCDNCLNSCDPITGICHGITCEANFIGQNCDIAILPIAHYPPEIISVGSTYVTVSVQKDYQGETPPKYVVIETRALDDKNWFGIKYPYNRFRKNYTVTNLRTDTEYDIRVVLNTKEKYGYRGSRIPIVNFITLCADINSTDLSVSLTNTTFTMSIDNPQLACLFGNYDFALISGAFEEHNVLRKTNIVEYLKPYTNYTLKIMDRDRRAVFDKHCRTEEGVPGIIRNLTLVEIGNVNATIRWLEPLDPNGIIRKYIVEYKLLQHLNCGEPREIETTKSLATYTAQVVLSHLHPYSEYIVNIRAVTICDGEPSIIQFRTKLSNITEMDIPNMDLIESQNSLRIELVWSCENQTGPTDYSVHLICQNAWCVDESLYGFNSSFRPAQQKQSVSFHVSGYTNYSVELQIYRPNVPLFTKQTFYTTKPRGPGKVTNLTVHSVTDTSVGLRWLPPYPPYGIVESYSIKVIASGGSTQIFTLNQDEYCPLWKGYVCRTINDLKRNEIYTFAIVTKYKNVSDYGKYSTIHATTGPKVPSPPLNITLNWDQKYNLTVSWLHPSIPNGALERFVIVVQKETTEYYNITKERPQYSYRIDASTMTARLLRVEVGVENKATGNLTSYADEVVTHSPPKTPEFLKNPIMQDVTSSSFKIALSNVTNVEGSTSIIANITEMSTFRWTSSVQSGRDYNEISLHIIIQAGRKMFVIITDLHRSIPYGDAIHRDYFEKILLKRSSSSWFLAVYDLSTFSATVIDYDNGERLTTPFDAHSKLPAGLLLDGHSYKISIVLNSSYFDFDRYKVYSLEFTVSGGEYEFLLALVLIPMALCAVFIILFKRYYNKIGSNLLTWHHSEDTTEFAAEEEMYDVPRTQPFEIPTEQIYETPTGQIYESAVEPLYNEAEEHVYESATELFTNNLDRESSSALLRNSGAHILNQIGKLTKRKYTKSVSIGDLDEYVRETIRNGELEKQFKDISNGQAKVSSRGMMPENKDKNAVLDIPAYDHSRVQLEIENDDPFSDYINANFIDGYNSQKTYIATQGPNENTIDDFWRMIWQEKVEYIVVVSEVIEKAQRKFEKYWPEINGYTCFGEIQVTYNSVKVFANYEIRSFDILHAGETRCVEQLQFSSSPDGGIPPYIRSFASFSKKVLSLIPGASPILVHGSDGFGRTGMLILCDICLRMALAEGKVDVFHHLYKLREQRANMIENAEQYKIAHFVLLQILQCISTRSQTGIVCSRTMKYEIDDVIATKLDKQLKFLDDSAWQGEAMRAINWNANYPNINPKRKFRFKTDDLSQATFYPYSSEDSSQIYIRAEVVDSFLTPSRFIVTRNPTISTIGVFWQLIVEKQIKTILCLNKLNPMDKAACMFYPTSNAFSFNPVPNLEVNFASKSSSSHYDIYNITATNTVHQVKTAITVIQLSDWHQSSLHPNNPSSLTTAYESMNDLGKFSSTILITCHDGIRACGLYMALCYLLEKIKSDHICDVCLAVQTVRQSRREFVRPTQQFQFLYECGYEYVRQFETYANFSPGTKKSE